MMLVQAVVLVLGAFVVLLAGFAQGTRSQRRLDGLQYEETQRCPVCRRHVEWAP